jgi:hypothetical protein
MSGVVVRAGMDEAIYKSLVSTDDEMRDVECALQKESVHPSVLKTGKYILRPSHMF